MCRALTLFTIDANACHGCHVCVAACPAEAVRGERKQVHTIDGEACVSCGACFDACKLGAVRFAARQERVVA